LLAGGELKRRADQAVRGLADCAVCPRCCAVDRIAGETGDCGIGRHARVASYCAHPGEEDPLRGWRGSGTVFFSGCNLHCVFCQNADISQHAAGNEATPRRLADMMLELQDRGCHNINWVTPEHVVPQALEALAIAAEDGLHLPIVYNTSAFDSIDTLRLLDGVVDIYMPDFKCWSAEDAEGYLGARGYPDAARAAVREMHRQVGDFVTDDRGLARHGLLVRHLVMPGGLADSREILRFLAEEISPDTYVNLMDQYRPANRVDADHYRELNRGVTPDEMAVLHRFAREVGLHRFDQRLGQAAL